MLDIRLIREEPHKVKEGLRKRSIDTSIVDQILELDQDRRNRLQEVEALKHERNDQSALIGKMVQEGKNIDSLRQQMKILSDQITEKNQEVQDVEVLLQQRMWDVPNLPDSSVPIGASAEDNPVVKTWGSIPQFSFAPLSHIELGEKNQWIDFERGVKLAGNKFVLLKGNGAKASRKLQSIMLDNAESRGYMEILPPFVAKREVLFGSGQLPKFEEDLYKIDQEDSFLISTGEVALVNLLANEVLSSENLPLKLTAATSCFRREAGAAGKETRGLIRVHQFEKVELVRLTKPEDSWNALEEMLLDAESVLQKLRIPYRVVTLCTGDLTAFSSAKTYDIEVWFPSMNQYVEISSVSNCLDFQSRRANIRYRDGNRELQFVHTLNGSGVAVGRCLAALMENRQKEDGTLDMEDVLSF